MGTVRSRKPNWSSCTMGTWPNKINPRWTMRTLAVLERKAQVRLYHRRTQESLIQRHLPQEAQFLRLARSMAQWKRALLRPIHKLKARAKLARVLTLRIRATVQTRARMVTTPVSGTIPCPKIWTRETAIIEDSTTLHQQYLRERSRIYQELVLNIL